MHLFLHIGPPKTGSTSIQKRLTTQEEALKNAGILSLFNRNNQTESLPLRALGLRYKPSKALKDWRIKQKFETPKAARDWSDAHWRDLAKTVRQSDADLCVISSEHLGVGLDVPNLVADFHEIFSGMTVLAYARDPASLYFSSMQQQLKGGKKLSALRTPQNYVYKHRTEIEKFVDVLGAENVVVRNFSRDNLKGNDVVLDFFAQLERFGKFLDVDPIQANESISGASLAILMLINEANEPGENSGQRGQILKRMRTSKSLAQMPSFPPDLPWARTLIRARAADDCAWLNQKFLSGQKLLPVEDGPIPKYPGDEAWRATLRDALLGYLTPEALAILGPEIIHL